MAFDGKKFGAEMSQIVRSHVAKELEPVLKRLEALEAEVEKSSPFRKRKGGRK